ncbi:MAG: class C beta-lactamase-related serine hydrolase [Bacteroidetes bacterium]|nr:MAG: class C beta-lactamase-related serine hydrolase [Bacteroidota bacterium]REK05774.1 MAG: class C beta-lactamase-related serine hydrolase [Bacteroidota bacterium]REK31920.1 MAG: class C beta-lactamase-related serine hydrolase [Bacteroidota bacterium]REK49985.1 MAG: class C beta-lactamase-related serine hydrolase [Bacteroidota bacterium]
MVQDEKKKNAGIWAKLLGLFLFLIISLNAAIWITGCTYVYKALVYTYPDTDDIDIFDVRSISAKNPRPWPLSHSYNKYALPASTLAKLEELDSEAFLVIREDSLIYEQYWDQLKENTVSNSFSVAKSIVGLLVGIAQEEKLFSIEDPVSRYLPSFSEGRNAELRIQDLLTMSSGLNWDESYSSLFSKTTEAYYGSNLRKLVKELKVIEIPGTRFSYMSCNTLILGMIIEKASGQNLSAYAAEKLWTPLGAEYPAFWSLDKTEGVEKSYCCYYSTARDFARIGKLIQDSGVWYGKRIVSSEFIKASLSPHGIPDESGNKTDYYGYHWWMLDHKGHKIAYARGILGQYIVAVPERKLIFVRLGNKRGEKVLPNHYDDMINYLDGVLDTF